MEIPQVPASQDSRCPECGRPLSTDAPGGLCPACLLRQGANLETETGGLRTRFVPPSPAELAPIFPQLEILALIGKGGMGAVYRARQPELDRTVALKILPVELDEGGDFGERFNREARALARLSHPNIVALHEFGRTATGPSGCPAGLHFFLMEFVEGASLRQLQASGRLAPRQALAIVSQVCDALQYAHDEGVVHRDIKPENILVDRRGRVRIADFGLAKLLGSPLADLRLTREGQVMGTPHYMAPEQVERPAEVDHRADIYSLGVVFYELLTGELPLGRFAPPSRRVEVDVRLDDVVLRALEKEPERRYQRAAEVKTGVEGIALGGGGFDQRAESHPIAPSPVAGYDWRARLALGLLLGALLGTPVLIASLAQDEWALAFGGMAMTLAVLFGALSWRDRIGRGVVGAGLGMGVLLGIGALALVYGWFEDHGAAARAAAHQAIQLEQLAREAQRSALLADLASKVASPSPAVTNPGVAPALIEGLDEKIERLRRPGTTMGDALAHLGEPVKYALGHRIFSRDRLPESYLACYPGGVELWVDQGRIKELRSLRPGPGFTFRGRLRVGSTLSEVTQLLGAPAETVVGRTLPWTLASGGPYRSKAGVLFRDINDSPGLAYYDRSDEGVRFFLKDDRIIAMLVQVPH